MDRINEITRDEIEKGDNLYIRMAALPENAKTALLAIFNGYLIGYELGSQTPERSDLHDQKRN